jgi:hypothetical protein
MAALGVPLWIFYGVVAADVRCGERCGTGPWYESGEGWQWHGQLAIVGVGVLVLIAAAVLAGRGGSAATAGLALTSAALLAVWMALVGTHLSLG